MWGHDCFLLSLFFFCLLYSTKVRDNFWYKIYDNVRLKKIYLNYQFEFCITILLPPVKSEACSLLSLLSWKCKCCFVQQLTYPEVTMNRSWMGNVRVLTFLRPSHSSWKHEQEVRNIFVALSEPWSKLLNGAKISLQ